MVRSTCHEGLGRLSYLDETTVFRVGRKSRSRWHRLCCILGHRLSCHQSIGLKHYRRRIVPMAKQLAFDEEAFQHIREGVTKLARAVKSTLGPRGRNAVLDKSWGAPTVTKDGVTVAEEVELENPYENMAAQLGKEGARKTP